MGRLWYNKSLATMDKTTVSCLQPHRNGTQFTVVGTTSTPCLRSQTVDIKWFTPNSHADCPNRSYAMRVKVPLKWSSAAHSNLPSLQKYGMLAGTISTTPHTGSGTKMCAKISVPHLEQRALGGGVLSAQHVHRGGGLGNDARPSLLPLAPAAFHLCSHGDRSVGAPQQPF